MILYALSGIQGALRSIAAALFMIWRASQIIQRTLPKPLFALHAIMCMLITI
jgi:hypothetical protein